jgi:hypothetical protein
MGKTQVFIEALTLEEATLDAEQRTARQVLIRAGRSANGRVYRPEVLMQAAPLFEGVKTYANHPSAAERRDRPERSTRDVTGWLTDVEWREGALYATRHFARTQAGNDTWALVEDVVTGRAPTSLVGASINAVGQAVKGDNGDWLVEAIEYVHSVDDVTTPAAGGGFVRLGESAGDDLTGALLAALDYDEWYEAGKARKFTSRLQNELKAIRQTEALKAAEAEAERTALALQEAQDNTTSLTEQVAMLARQVAESRRDLLLEKALRRVNLPAAWEHSLREQLTAADPEQWAGIIDNEKQKAALLPKSRPAVTGAGARVAEAVITAPGPQDLTPREHEDVEAWRRRISKERNK